MSFSESTCAPEPPITVFIAYSHKDEKLRQALSEHLSLLRRTSLIADWYDRRITAGHEWKGEIDRHLNTAQLILLLVSSSFVSSDYCYDVEMKRELERHTAGDARVIPIILRDCDWKDAPFGKLQVLPTDARPITAKGWKNTHEAFADVVKGLRAALLELTQSNRAAMPVIAVPVHER